MKPLPCQFIVVDPRLLPRPHNPSQCHFYDRALWDSRLPLAQIQSRWSETASGRWSECRYHSGDWKTVASAACWVLGTQLERDPESWSGTPSMMSAGYPGRALVEDERDAVGSLLWEPISWTPGADYVMDGQHRACALRVAGALKVPVLDERLL